jgi:hypothetical protein
MVSSCSSSRLLQALVLVMVVNVAPLVARAADCPVPPAALKERRSLAKEWFTRAETEELGADHIAAVRAYSCSFTMLPHPSTAYNLARAAERAGDLKLAISAHRDYLTLKPTASDRPETEERIKTLEEKLARGGPAGDPTLPTPPPPPPVVAEPTPEPIAPPPPPPRRKPRPVEPVAQEGTGMGTTEWIIAGVGAAALVAGVVFNVGARSAMEDCRTLAETKNIAGAREACDRGKRFAYLSYGLFGAAGAAAILDLTLVLSKRPAVETVGVVLVPGGATVAARGTF